MADINEILGRPCHKAYSARGSSMGRVSQAKGEPESLHLQKMRFTDGDYDAGGAYWGYTPGKPMWCAFSPEGTQNEVPIMVFARAANRRQAMEKILEILGEGWTFLRASRE